jgi:DNA-binding SARP family transcriptional activator
MLTPPIGRLDAIVQANRWGYVAATLGDSRTRIQLCGKLVAEIEGVRVDAALPGRQGRLLFGYLVAHRHRPTSREALTEVLWPERPPTSADATVRPLISRLRQVLGDRLQGRSALQLLLPGDARIDVEAASAAVHDAESAIAQERWQEAWLPARVAWSVTSRELMAGYEGHWLNERRVELDELRLQALECIAQVGIRLGGAELPSAEKAARSLVKSNPYRESGYLLLMEALEARANVAEALRVYDDARCRLRDDLGVAPGPELTAAHRRFLNRM